MAALHLPSELESRWKSIFVHFGREFEPALDHSNDPLPRLFSVRQDGGVAGVGMQLVVWVGAIGIPRRLIDLRPN
jgi:hypothetical protein